jgi:hypothetical protein
MNRLGFHDCSGYGKPPLRGLILTIVSPFELCWGMTSEETASLYVDEEPVGGGRADQKVLLMFCQGDDR